MLKRMLAVCCAASMLSILNVHAEDESTFISLTRRPESLASLRAHAGRQTAGAADVEPA